MACFLHFPYYRTSPLLEITLFLTSLLLGNAAMARAAGGMFDFSQIQIPANLLAGALLFEIVNEHSIGLKVVRSTPTPAIQEGLEAQAAQAQLLPGPG